MSVINRILCQDTVKNLGICDCFFDPKNIVGAIIVPKSKVFTDDELSDDDIQSTIETAILAAKASRIYPFVGFVGMTDSSEDPTQQTFGYGKSETVREGNYKWMPNFRKGGVNLSNALRSFNGKQTKYAVIFVESSNTLIGTLKKDADGADGLAGIPMDDLYTRPWKANDGSNVTQYGTMFSFEPVYVNENIAYRKVNTLTYLFNSMNGLTDVKISQAAIVNAKVTVKALTSCGEDMYELFADELNAAGAWKLANSSTGGIITISGVAKNDTLKAWEITWAASGDADLPAATGQIDVSMVTAAALAALNVVRYESDTLTVTRPA